MAADIPKKPNLPCFLDSWQRDGPESLLVPDSPASTQETERHAEKHHEGSLGHGASAGQSVQEGRDGDGGRSCRLRETWKTRHIIKQYRQGPATVSSPSLVDPLDRCRK